MWCAAGAQQQPQPQSAVSDSLREAGKGATHVGMVPAGSRLRSCGRTVCVCGLAGDFAFWRSQVSQSSRAGFRRAAEQSSREAGRLSPREFDPRSPFPHPSRRRRRNLRSPPDAPDSNRLEGTKEHHPLARLAGAVGHESEQAQVGVDGLLQLVPPRLLLPPERQQRRQQRRRRCERF